MSEATEAKALDRGQEQQDPLVQQIAATLQENNVALLQAVVSTLGVERTQTMLQKTLEIEAAGGLLTDDQQRRRTPGGVFFYTIKGNITKEERKLIFPRAQTKRPKKKKKSNPTPAVAAPTWDETRQLIHWGVTLADDKKGEARTVKLTVIGRPNQIKTTPTCAVITMKAKRPPALPKGLPNLPEGVGGTVVVFIANKQWQKVAKSITENPNDELIIEGYPLFDAKNKVTAVMAQNCLSKVQQRAEREARKG
ncbi:MAG: phosphorylated adapter RNA export RNA-binding domain-containing protein [Caldilineaceae bacterium]